jgi:O-acetyl-ADP-ribose deacetylase (regulator of RNase III)
MPAISTGAFGYPLENCATTMLTQIIDFTFEDLKHLRTIILCLPDELTFEAFKHEFEQQLEALRESGEAQV